MRTFDVKPATPEDTHIRLALSGPAGSGKTVSALRLATGFGGKIVMIDTENNRAKKYAKQFQFEHIDFQPPFNPASYEAALMAAQAAGAATAIIDSASHEHEGPGGVLEMAEDFLDKKCGNDFKKRDQLKMTAWIKPKAERNRFITFGLQRVNMNVILCFRAKDKIEIRPVEKNGRIVNTPMPIGLQPIGGEDYYYEMDVLAMLPAGSQGKPDWSCPAARINDLDGALIKALHATQQFTEETGKIIRQLNSSGKTASRSGSTTTASNAQTASPELLKKGENAALGGVEEYVKWRDALSAEDKEKIRPYNAEWSRIAKESDKAF